MNREEGSRHTPVLCREVVSLFAEQRRCSSGNGESAVVVDGTVGLGGHASALLSALPWVRIIGIDRDEEALTAARRRLRVFGERATVLHGNVREIATLLSSIEVTQIDGLLLDLGVSSLQLDDPERGFSFRSDGPLDMRMDRSQSDTAGGWINTASEAAIGQVLRDFGEERYWRRIARAIVVGRAASRIASTSDLRQIVHHAVPKGYFRQSIDPATRTFQAVRIVVNDELGALGRALEDGFTRLRDGGLLVVISFHSLEDRIVKRFVQERAAACTCPPDLPECLCGKTREAEILTRKPVIATAAEVQANPRARSAKLRACRRVV